MLRGKVTAVTDAGVFVQTADYTVGPCQAVIANYSVGDTVLLSNVGDDASPDLVVVGKLTAKGGVTTGATTDNAVARFDGTSGALQNSGVAIDDSGYVTAKRSNIDGTAASQEAILFFLASGTFRWKLYRDNAVESGSNAGSNLRLDRRADDGPLLGTALASDRATGRATTGDVGTTAGIELGSGGPTITTGTGAPSHTAPNGSVYLRTDGTASTTLYVRAAGAWSALS